MKIKKIASAAIIALGCIGGAAQAQVVDLELALLIDVSGSVNTTEFNLQRQGYVDAFNSAAIQTAIAGGRSLAATVIYWSSTAVTAVGWSLIDSAASASSFAGMIASAARPGSVGNATGPGTALNFAAPLFFNNSFTSNRQIIDVSGDGRENIGADTSNARDAALALGIDQINGLPILGEGGLLAFYQNNIQGGAGSFVIAADSFADFGAAVQTKIGREIVGNVPEPSTYALMALGLGAMGFLSRRRKAAAAA